MKLLYAGVTKECILNKGINIKCTESTQEKIVKNIFNKKTSDMLGFIDLPYMSEDEINGYIELGTTIEKKYTDMIVLGIGGSALGIKMLKNTFLDSINKKSKCNVRVCDNIDSDTFVTMLDNLNLKKTMFNIITKSGSTSETLAQMMIVISRMKSKKIDISKHMVITTTKDNALYNFAVENNIPTCTIPESVGGRFSVLSSVGLLPAVVMGIDIVKLLNGAKVGMERCKLTNEKNIAFTSAFINYTYLGKGRTNLVTMPYSDRLSLVPEFFAQLWGESLGKKNNLKGEVVYAGQTPIKSLGVTDQHSQLQLYSEGVDDKVIMFMTVDKSNYDEVIDGDIELAKHLKGTTLKELLDYEYISTAFSLVEVCRPSYTISIPSITEESMGELIVFMEMMTAFMGSLLKVNAFDQPGVELSKIYTKGCLKLKGYEKYGENIKNFKKFSTKFSL